MLLTNIYFHRHKQFFSLMRHTTSLYNSEFNCCNIFDIFLVVGLFFRSNIEIVNLEYVAMNIIIEHEYGGFKKKTLLK